MLYKRTQDDRQSAAGVGGGGRDLMSRLLTTNFMLGVSAREEYFVLKLERKVSKITTDIQFMFITIMSWVLVVN